MRILVVEDEEKIAQFILRGLKEERYAADHAKNGQEALNMVELYSYDLIITDIMMPGIDGFELIRKLRAKNIKLPILVLSAKDQIDDKIKGLDLGADDYLAKPFSFDELLARVRALFRRKSDLEDELTIADLVMIPHSHTVTRGGKSITLTQKEFAILEYLLRNKGRVLTRTSIIEHVWDMNFDSDTNLVDVFMSYLRKKIEKRPYTRLIHSVRGVGYILKEES